MDKVDTNQAAGSSPLHYPPSVIMTFNQASDEQATAGPLQCKVMIKGLEHDVEYLFDLKVPSRAETYEEYLQGKPFKITSLEIIGNYVHMYYLY